MSEVRRVLNDQAGVIARGQAIEAGLAPHEIRRLLRRREWVVVHPGVYVWHTGPLTWLQRAWAAVLFAWPAALGHESALRAAEGPGRGRDESVIEVAVGRDRRIRAPEGVRIQRMTHLDSRVQWNLGPPRVRYAEAVLDVAVAAPSDWAALGVIAQACQSSRTSATIMRDSLRDRARVGRRDWLTAVLADLADGACSVLEHGYLTRVERAHGLPRAARQRRAGATLGVVYRDAVYDELVVELDGRLFHNTTRARDRDMQRDLDAAAEGWTTVRLSYGQVFDRPCVTAQRLGVLLRRHGWRGTPRPCGPDCPVARSLDVTG